VLFGGESPLETATLVPYDSDETWIWSGSRWTQVFPEVSPAARSAFGFVYDSNRGRGVLFGGRQARTEPEGEISLLGDTWSWNDGKWQQLFTPNAPEARHLHAMAYDSVRDRVVVFGGSRRNAANTAFEPAYDTWEFDGTTWTRVAVENEPKVNVPQLVYDAARNQVILMGTDQTFATLMYVYEPNNRAWRQLTPEKLPGCVNDAVLTYRAHTGTVILIGGVCSITTSTTDQTWEWNGTNWSEVTTNNLGRGIAQAIAYDALRDTIVAFGGFSAFNPIPRSFTSYFTGNAWKIAFVQVRPEPRSLHTFRTDPVSKTVWLFGGLNEFATAYSAELWGYRNGQWFPNFVTGAPFDCTTPVSAWDSNRSRLVVICGGQGVFEFDGKAWTNPDPRDEPDARRFPAVVYDENLKKIVLFGGYDNANFRNDTWTWDGTTWTEIRRDRPNQRSLMSMWYDPQLKKTVLYGGLGRRSINERITRYSDMWSFDGTQWTKMNVSSTPGERFGAQIAIDPRTNKLILFGGLRSEPVEGDDDRRRQFFDNDTWEWDGAANRWTRLEPAVSPRARQNGTLAWDPLAEELVLYGGYSGFYYSDTWVFEGDTWRPRVDAIGRRRPSGRPTTPVTPSFTMPNPRRD
ncbi:MAG TPA: hypothetical protein VHL59_04500, partial [Thermoanaerobaculia bacterium]|nr:hypothetical protein [Thermoanaerobaculia bacterium]